MQHSSYIGENCYIISTEDEIIQFSREGDSVRLSYPTTNNALLCVIIPVSEFKAIANLMLGNQWDKKEG